MCWPGKYISAVSAGSEWRMRLSWAKALVGCWGCRLNQLLLHRIFFFFFIWKTGGQVMFPQTWASGSHLVISLKMRQLSELLPEKQRVVFIANDTIWIFKQKLEFGRKCQGQKSLVGYRPWDGKELEVTGRLSTHTSCQEADRFPAQPLLMRSAVMLTNVIFLFRMLFNEMVPR